MLSSLLQDFLSVCNAKCILLRSSIVKLIIDLKNVKNTTNNDNPLYVSFEHPIKS